MNHEKIEQLEKEIKALKERNQRVELDKAWETSRFRIALLTAITYIIANILLYLIGVQNFYFAALVPAAGFFLSVQSLPTIKNRWIKNRQRNKNITPS